MDKETINQLVQARHWGGSIYIRITKFARRMGVTKKNQPLYLTVIGKNKILLTKSEISEADIKKIQTKD